MIVVGQGEPYKSEEEEAAMDQTDTESNEAGQEGTLSSDQVSPVAPKVDAHGETGQWHVNGPKKNRVAVQPLISPKELGGKNSM